MVTDEVERDPKGFLHRIHAGVDVRADLIADRIWVRYRPGATEQRLPGLRFQSLLDPSSIQRALAGKSATRRLWRVLRERRRCQIDRMFTRAAYELDLRSRSTKIDPVDSDRVTLGRRWAHFARRPAAHRVARKRSSLAGVEELCLCGAGIAEAKDATRLARRPHTAHAA